MIRLNSGTTIRVIKKGKVDGFPIPNKHGWEGRKADQNYLVAVLSASDAINAGFAVPLNQLLEELKSYVKRR